MDYKAEYEKLKKINLVLNKETDTLKQIIDNKTLEVSTQKEINEAQKKINGNLQTKLSEANMQISNMKDPLNQLRKNGDIQLARYNYFGFGDHFSEFHRKHDGISGIDLDFVETCPKCKEPLAFFETAFDKGQTFKATTTTEWIARKCAKPSFLVFYKPGEKMDEIEVFRVQILLSLIHI